MCVSCAPVRRLGVGTPTLLLNLRSHIDMECGRAAAQEQADSVPLFVLERMAHIRCYCLTVRAGGGGARQLVGAAVEVHETVVAVSCRFAGQEVSCCLQLDLGEELEGRSGTMMCQVADGYAYVQLPLAEKRGPVFAKGATPLPQPKVVWCNMS